MKDQYFGDLNDFKKYGLLRILTAWGELSMAVCWMLTEPDGRTDGRFITYLREPHKWRGYDPELFESLAKCLATPGYRSVSWADAVRILPSAGLFPKILKDDPEARALYFEKFTKMAKGSDLVFFDPDNGIEVPSVPYGKKNSAKYLYWNELIAAWKLKQSVIVYQHFPRTEHLQFTQDAVEELQLRTGCTDVMTFTTTNVLYLLAPQPRHVAFFHRQGEELGRVWGSHIRVALHQRQRLMMKK